MTPPFDIQTFKDWRYLADYLVDASDESAFQLLDNLLMQSVKFGQFFWALPVSDQEVILNGIRDSLVGSNPHQQYLQEPLPMAAPAVTAVDTEPMATLAENEG